MEERLNFFETGAPVSKNADAIQKALTAIAADLDADDDDEDDINEDDIKDAAAAVERDQKEAQLAPKEPLDAELSAIVANKDKQ